MTWILRASLGIWGLALAIGFLPRLVRPAGPDDLAGAMRSLGISASVPPTQFAFLIVLPFVVTLLFGRRVAVLAERPWAAWCFAIALASAPVTLMHYGNIRHVVLHGLVAVAIFFARRLEPRFTRTDIVLIPTLLVLYFAFLDLDFGRTPAATFFRAAIVLLALRLLIGWLSKSTRPALAFAAAPLGFLAQMQTFESVVAGAIALLWVVGTCLLLTRLEDASLQRFAAYIAYPIAAAAYPLALLGWSSPLHVDVFEDSHSLLPASEMSRGELPYRDVAPIHGLVSDGLLDLAVMQTIDAELGPILRTRRLVGALTVAAIYFVALGATTSADLALLAVFLSLALSPSSSVWLRALAPLLVLAATAAATRLRAPRWFGAAGALLVASILVSLDLAVFSGIVAVVAALRARAMKHLLVGFGAAAVPVLIAFTFFGLTWQFLHSSVVEVIGSSGVYVMGPLEVPEGLRTLGAMVSWIGDASTLASLAWFAALIASAAALTISPLRARRSDAVWLIGLWIVLAGATYVVRRHYYFAFAMAPFLIGGFLALRRHSRPATIAAAIVLAIIAKPFAHVFDVAAPLRRSEGLVAGESTEYAGTPRARGAVFDPITTQALGSVQRFLRSALRPDETFYDFASVGLLYYLFERDCPVRYMTVPAAQRPESQQEVIAALERNRRVRAVLIAFPTTLPNIDEVPNAERAPLVWSYLRQHFRPAFNENGVVFWVRR